MICPIRNVDVARGVHGHAGGGSKPRRAAGAIRGARAAGRACQRRHHPAGRDLSDRVVIFIRDVDVTRGVHGHAAGVSKPRRAAGVICRTFAAGRAGQRGKSVVDRDRERVAGGRRRVEAGGGGLGGRDRGGTDGEAGDHTGGGIHGGNGRTAAGVANRAVAAAGEGRGDGVGQRGATGDRGDAWRGEGQRRRRARRESSHARVRGALAVGRVGGVAVGRAGGEAGGVDSENTCRGRAGEVGHAGAAELGITVGRSGCVHDADRGEADAAGPGHVATEGRTRRADIRARGRGDRRSALKGYFSDSIVGGVCDIKISCSVASDGIRRAQFCAGGGTSIATISGLRDCSIGTNARQDRNCTRYGGDGPISGHFPDDSISCVRDIKVAGRIHSQACWTRKHRAGGGPSVTSVAIRIRVAD